MDVKLKPPAPKVEPPPLDEIDSSDDQKKPPAKTLAEKCEGMLNGATSPNLKLVYLLVFCGLGLMNYVLGDLLPFEFANLC